MIQKNQRIRKEHISNFILLTILIVLTIFRFVIQLKVPPSTLAGRGVDEHVFIVQATEYIKVNWLGNYDFITLVKNPALSFFYVLLNKFGIPYPIGLISLHIFACIALIVALFPIVKNKYYCSFFYLFLLYTPVLIDKHFGFRLYRDALLTPLLLLVFASLIGLFLYRNKPKFINLGWSLLAGISFSAFYYLREDSMWLVPFFLTALIITGIFVLFNKIKAKEKIVRIILLVIPLLVLQGVTSFISDKNYQKYGVKVVNDHTKTYFRNVITDLISIDDKRNQENIWVYEDTLREAMKVSPTLNKISEQVDWLYGPESGMTVYAKETKKDEVFGGNIVWDLRLLVARAAVGYRPEVDVDGDLVLGGKATDAYFKQVHEELTDAFNSGRLKKRQNGIAISKSAPAKTWDDIRTNVLPKMGIIVKQNLFYTKYSGTGSLTTVSGSPEAIREIEMLINYPLNYPVGTPEEAYNKPITGMIKKVDKIIKLYKWTSPLVILMSLAGFIYACISLIKRKFTQMNITVVLVTLGLLLSYIVLVLGVSWAYSWVEGSTLSRVYYYSSSAIPLLHVVYILGMISFFDLLQKYPFREKLDRYRSKK